MMYELTTIFQTVAAAMREHKEIFNQADSANHNHGDHMLEIFLLAAQAAREMESESLGDVMDCAAKRLGQLVDNGTAKIYAQGLSQFALQFRQYGVEIDDLVSYVQELLGDKGDLEQVKNGPDKENRDVLKALTKGLAGWQGEKNGKADGDVTLSMTYLFDLGVAYMAAKARGGSKPEIIADAAISVSPLKNVAYRAESGKLAIQKMLETMQNS
jgi:hypothetical protein